LARTLKLRVVTLAAFVAALMGADWPHLRGPNYDGTSAETGLASTWPIDGPPRLWLRELGQGYSGFAVADGRVFTQRQTMGGQYLLCLDAATGETLWEVRYDMAWHRGGAYPGPYASPTWYCGKVFFASPTGVVGCADADTGRLRWSLNVRDAFQGKGSDFGYAATPLVEDERVVLPVGGATAGLVALHADDGRTLWTAGVDPASYCPALPITFRGRRLVVGYLQNNMVLVDMATGAVVHHQPLSTGYDEHAAWPLYREPHLMLAAPFRTPSTCYRLEEGPGDSLQCRPHWTSRNLANDVASSVLYGEHVYGFDLLQPQASRHRASRGAFRCLEWSTGKTRWSSEQVGQASLIAVDSKLLLFNDSGSLILAAADPGEYRELARTELFDGEICWTPPALSQGRLFVRSPTRAICVYVGSAETAPPPGTAFDSPGRPWRFNISWLVSREREYPNDAPSREEMTLWFLACVLDMIGAALATAAVLVLARRFLDRQLAATPICWSFIFVLGVLGPGALSTLCDRLLFTWPAALYAAFHATLLICWWAEAHPARRRARWLARLAFVGLALVGYGYFELCRAAGMYIGWTFLFGFPAAFPLTLLAARAEKKGQRAWIVAAWTLPAFAAYFASCQALLLWKALQ
jgi:outer membrane protein assembly factor BamB